MRRALVPVLAAAAVLGGVLAGSGSAAAGPSTQACAWTENVDSWIMGHNVCGYAVKWVVGLPDPLSGPSAQATYTRCVASGEVRDIARRGTPLKGYVRC